VNQGDNLGEQTWISREGAYVGQHLNHSRSRKAPKGRKPGSEPDSGKPTVRDRREAYGNMGNGTTIVACAVFLSRPP